MKKLMRMNINNRLGKQQIVSLQGGLNDEYQDEK